MTQQALDTIAFQQGIARLRGNPTLPANVSIVIPVNAQADFEKLLLLLTDIMRYNGKYTCEIVLVINNYPKNQPPAQIEQFTNLGMTVVSVPNVRRKGEAVAFTARMYGLPVASSDHIVTFDADARISDATALLDWYVHQFQAGAQVAYTRIDFFDLHNAWSVRVRVMAFHLVGWFNRVILGIPTTRGVNYAFNRLTILALYEQGYLADELNVGPTVKAQGGRTVYCGSKELTVLNSGSHFKPGWRRLFWYLLDRFGYNMRVLRVRKGAAEHTKRTHSTEGRRYAVFLDDSIQNHKQSVSIEQRVELYATDLTPDTGNDQ